MCFSQIRELKCTVLLTFFRNNTLLSLDVKMGVQGNSPKVLLHMKHWLVLSFSGSFLYFPHFWGHNSIAIFVQSSLPNSPLITVDKIATQTYFLLSLILNRIVFFLGYRSKWGVTNTPQRGDHFLLYVINGLVCFPSVIFYLLFCSVE